MDIEKQARNAMYSSERNFRCDANFENIPDVVPPKIVASLQSRF
jgi:hypothetical protein